MCPAFNPSAPTSTCPASSQKMVRRYFTTDHLAGQGHGTSLPSVPVRLCDGHLDGLTCREASVHGQTVGHCDLVGRPDAPVRRATSASRSPPRAVVTRKRVSRSCVVSAGVIDRKLDTVWSKRGRYTPKRGVGLIPRIRYTIPPWAIHVKSRVIGLRELWTATALRTARRPLISRTVARSSSRTPASFSASERSGRDRRPFRPP